MNFKTWDPIIGCSPISEGCDPCFYRNDWVTFHPEVLEEPLFWPEGTLIHLCSRGDFFHNQAKTKWQLKVLGAINRSKAIFLILTKRPCIAVRKMLCDDKPLQGFLGHPRVWMGIVAESGAWIENRLPHLLALDFKMRFISKSCQQ